MHERLTERFVDRRTSVLMRRLRENTTLETEIKKTGEVVVEGHEIGRLDGFTFVADASAAGSEAKTLQGAARSALAGEIDARATKVTQGPDREFVLSSDGSVRWTGAPVGKLIAGDDVLRPRLRVIADEQLTGASREAVQTRLDLWLKNHIERLLGPLFALAAAEDVTGIARGVAYQLIEQSACWSGRRLRKRSKASTSRSRALLRKYGVRFGAYHLYMPTLLKPAPRSLAAQLWMLKHENPEAKGARRPAAAGIERPDVDPRRQGHAEGALPYDRLSRLRRTRDPRRHSGAACRSHPAGAGMARRRKRYQASRRVQRFRFTVTGAMTSLTGASGDDFASILRSLGYRMEKRPKPPEPETPAASAEPKATPEFPSRAVGRNVRGSSRCGNRDRRARADLGARRRAD